MKKLQMKCFKSRDSGVRFYDTAPMYGHGLSEYRTGYSLRWKNRSDFVLSSKVGRLLHPARKEDINYAPWTNAGRFEVEFNYSYDAQCGQLMIVFKDGFRVHRYSLYP